jgi:hypothetical protein
VPVVLIDTPSRPQPPPATPSCPRALANALGARYLPLPRADAASLSMIAAAPRDDRFGARQPGAHRAARRGARSQRMAEP